MSNNNKDRILKPTNSFGTEYSRLPPPGSKAREEIDHKEFLAEEEIKDYLCKLERASDPIIAKQDKAFEEYLARLYT